MATGRYRTTNQAEYGAPATGIFGQALKRNIAPAHIVNNPKPLYAVTGGFRGFIGVFVARPALASLVPKNPGGYRGILPLEQQPLLIRPKPWER